MQKKNRVDERLKEKTEKKSNYPTLSNWNMYQALARDNTLGKLLLLDLDRFYKKLFKNWGDFWDLCCDFNPEYCFICGRYVIPKMRGDKDRIKRPYKNCDIVHDYCFTKEMTVERTVAKLTPDAELICHLDLGWSIIGSVCRERVRNNPKAIAGHLIMIHHWSKIPEMVAGEINEGRYTEKQWKKDVSENNKKWFHDNQLDYDMFRNEHFLKPNGRIFRSLAQ